MKNIFLKEGLRMFRRNIAVRMKGLKRYNGNAEQISKQIINACWNKYFFQTSAGHFCEFWSRDFGWCVKALDNMGYRNEILATLRYAIKIFASYDKDEATKEITFGDRTMIPLSCVKKITKLD